MLGAQSKHATHSTIINRILIFIVSLADFCEDLQAQDNSEVILLWPKDFINLDIDNELHALNCSALNPEDFKKFINKKTDTNPFTKLPFYLYNFVDVFSKPATNWLPPHRPQDHNIRL